MKRKILMTFLAIMLVFGFTSCTPEQSDRSVETITLYSTSGTMQIAFSDKDEYLKNGWYTEPVITMYTVDGKTRITVESEVEKCKKDGWYIEPVVFMYSTNGETTAVPTTEIDEYKNNNWYTEPVVIMYDKDGSSSIIPKSDADIYLEKGWYAEPVAKIYNSRGEESLVLQREVEYYVSNGWYAEPVAKIYKPSGEESLVFQREVEYYKSKGWYAEPVITMYTANGRSSVIRKAEIDAYLKSGWYTSPVKTVKDETKILPKLFLNYHASNEEFISFANNNYPALSLIQSYVRLGAYFQIDYNVSFSDNTSPNGLGKRWLVTDKKVTTMEELKSFWYSYFSQSSDKTAYTEMYKEINGKLYSACAGVGAYGSGKPHYNKVTKINNKRMEITGTVDLYDLDGNYFDTRNTTFIMVLENNMWVCEKIT